MLKPIRHLIGAGILALLTVLAAGLAKFLPGFWFSFYTDFSRSAMGALGAATGWLPVPLWELLLAALVLSVPVGLAVAIKTRRVLGWLTGLLEFLVLLVFLFVGLWGLNHYAPPLKDQLGMEVETYTRDQLQSAAAYYAEQASLYSTRVQRDGSGDVALPEFEIMSDAAVEAYRTLGETNPRLAGTAPRVKPLLVSEAFAYTGTTGIFVCLTGEAGVSTQTFPLAQPFTLCHELGHSLAFAGEDEANFLAYLACRASEEDLLRYSGAYSAFIYCFNALYEQSPSGARSLWDLCSRELIHDAGAHVSFNKQYEGKVQEAAQSVNDAYLKTFDQEEGVRSYGLVVDYLIADWLAGNP